MVSALSSGDLRRALAILGEDAGRRDQWVSALRDLEPTLERPDFDVREEVTGPLVDALHAHVDVFERTLASGLVISCHYRSKIARDFAMATPDRPEHVWEPQTSRLLMALAPMIEDAVIGGAYFGDQAIPLAHALRTRGRCHCFELDPDHVAMLESNARRNHLDNVHVEAVGLWSSGEARLRLEGDDSHAAPVPSDDDSGFPTITIDDYGAREGLDRIGLIQLDIEGGEFAALRGATRYLEQPGEHAPVLLFEVHRRYQDWSGGLENTDIVRFVERYGYDAFAIRDYQGNVPMGDHPVEVIPVRDAYLEGPPHGFNVLAVKDKRITDRLRLSIVHGVSPKLLRHRDPALHQPLS